MLTLQPAFNDSSRSNLIRKITQENPTPLRQLCPTVPRDLEAIVLKAISRDPNHRYQSAGDLASDLQRFLEDHPVSARPMSTMERVWKWARRNRAVAASSAIAAVFLITTAAFATAQYVQRTRAWETESKLRTQADNERLRVEANLRLAAQAFDDVFGRVTGSPLSGSLDSEFEAEGSLEEVPSGLTTPPVVNERDAAILKGLLSFYDEFAKQNENDLRWQRETARAFRRAGEIQFRLGNQQEATASFRRSLTIFQRLSENDPANPEYIAKVAMTRNRVANIAWESGRGDIALAESRNTFQGLLRNPAILENSPACRIELARAYNQYAIASPQFHFSMRSGPSFGGHHRLDPREYLQRSLGITETLLADSPGNLEYCLTMAESYRYLWWLETRRKQHDAANRARDQAIHLLDDLAKSFPDEPECRFMLAEIYLLPFRYSTDIQSNEASQQTTRAMEIATELVNQFPQVPKHQVVLAQAMWTAARIYEANGRLEQSNDYLKRAISLQKSIVEQSPSRWRSASDLFRFMEERTDRIRDQKNSAELQASIEELVATFEKLPESLRSFSPLVRDAAKAYSDLAQVLKDQGLSEKAQAAEAKAKELSAQSSRWNRPFSRPPMPGPGPGRST